MHGLFLDARVGTLFFKRTGNPDPHPSPHCIVVTPPLHSSPFPFVVVFAKLAGGRIEGRPQSSICLSPSSPPRHHNTSKGVNRSTEPLVFPASDKLLAASNSLNGGLPACHRINLSAILGSIGISRGCTVIRHSLLRNGTARQVPK